MRSALAALAVVLSTLVVPVAITATWLSLRVDDTAAYVDTVEPLAEDPRLREALAREVGDAAVATLEENVPLELLPEAVGDVVRLSAAEVVESDSFPEFWREANADAHREFLAIVHERDEDVVADGYVVVDLRPLLDEVLEAFAAENPLVPADLLQSRPVPLPVMPESRLEEARGGYQLVEELAVWAPLLWLALVALAVLAARGARGRLRTGAACAFGVAVGGAVVTLLTSPATDALVDRVEPENQDLARLVVEVVVESLDNTALTAVIGGLVVGAALLVGSFVPARPASVRHP